MTAFSLSALFQAESIEYEAFSANIGLCPSTSQPVCATGDDGCCVQFTSYYLPPLPPYYPTTSTPSPLIFIPLPLMNYISPALQCTVRPFPRAILSSQASEPTSSPPASPHLICPLIARLTQPLLPLTHLIFRWNSPESSPLVGRTLPPSFSPPLSLVGVAFWLLGGPGLLPRPPNPPGTPTPPPSLWKAECSLGWKVERTLVPAGSMAFPPFPM